MLERIYFALWGLYFATAGVIYMSGMFNAKVAVAFGLVFFGMTFMGMISVLPFHVSHN